MMTNFNNLKLLEGRRFPVTKPPAKNNNNVLEVKQGKTDEHLSEYMQDQYVYTYNLINIKKGNFHI